MFCSSVNSSVQYVEFLAQVEPSELQLFYNTQCHKIPVSAIPCLNYRKGLEKEREATEPMATDEANETAAPEASLSTSAMTTSPADKSDEASAGTDTPASGAPAGTVCVQPFSSVFSRLRIGDLFDSWHGTGTKPSMMKG